MPLVECLLSVWYSSIQAATAWRACSRVRKCRRLSSSNSRVELNDSLAALSRADPVRESTERDRDVADGDMEEGITTRSASNQTSLAFHPGKVGSEVGGKSFFAVTVYATAT